MTKEEYCHNCNNQDFNETMGCKNYVQDFACKNFVPVAVTPNEIKKVISKWSLILLQDEGKEMTYSQSVIKEILADFTSASIIDANTPIECKGDLYATPEMLESSQLPEPPSVPTDEEIWDKIHLLRDESGQEFPTFDEQAFYEGAKWMRDLLTNKEKNK